MNMNSHLKITVILGALCLLTMLTGCKGTPQKVKDVVEDAIGIEEDQTTFWLNEEQENIVRKGNEFSIKLFRKIADDEGKKNVGHFQHSVKDNVPCRVFGSFKFHVVFRAPFPAKFRI